MGKEGGSEGLKTGREWGQRSGDATDEGQKRMLRRCSWRKWGRAQGQGQEGLRRRFQKEGSNARKPR